MCSKHYEPGHQSLLAQDDDVGCCCHSARTLQRSQRPHGLPPQEGLSGGRWWTLDSL